MTAFEISVLALLVLSIGSSFFWFYDRSKYKEIVREAHWLTTVCGTPGDAYWTPRVAAGIERLREMFKKDFIVCK